MRTKLGLLVLMITLFAAVPALAADEAGAPAQHAAGFVLFLDKGAAFFGATMGAALVVMGGAAGIGRIGRSAVESMARQPEASGAINGLALITAAMIEGATLFAVVVCLLALIF